LGGLFLVFQRFRHGIGQGVETDLLLFPGRLLSGLSLSLNEILPQGFPQLVRLLQTLLQWSGVLQASDLLFVLVVQLLQVVKALVQFYQLVQGETS